MAPDAPIRALIVDDEAAARRGLRLLLSRCDDVEVAGECGSVPEILPALRALSPDVVFLDVRMPGGTGIDALREGVEGARPLVILVTAFEEHALEAFDIEALDYLLKPFSDEAFERALGRVRRHLGRVRDQEIEAKLAAALDGLDPGATGGETDRIAIRYGQRIRLVDPATILWIEAEGDYVRIHTDGGEDLLRETMLGMEEALPAGRFVRIHRSTIVRLDFIREVRSRGRGRYAAILEDGVRRNISRQGQDRLERRLGITF